MSGPGNNSSSAIAPSLSTGTSTSVVAPAVAERDRSEDQRDDRLIAAADATTPHIGGSAQARIVNFRAGHLLFGVLDTDTPGDTVFFARGARGYTLTAIASSRVDGRDRRRQEPPRFAGLDDALDHILTELDPAPTA